MTEQPDIVRALDAVGFEFKNPELLYTALRHPSYIEEGKENNERLVFLGKNLLSFILADYVYGRNPFTPESELSERAGEARSFLCPENYLESSGLKKFVLLSKHAEALRNSPALSEEIFYAVIAAIYKDGGLASLKGFLLPMLRASGEPRFSRKEERIPEKRPSEIKKTEEPKPAEITVEKVVTVEEEPKKKQKSGLLRSLVSGKETKEKKPKKDKKEIPETPEEKPEEKEVSEKTSSPFIRDALAPVKLSEELRNPKPSGKTKKKSEVPEKEPEKIPEKKENAPEIPESENYKSLLQEYVQKNIRTANVLIKYETENAGKNKFRSTVTLDGKELATASEVSKKNAEKEAARLAYHAVTGGELKEWFSSLGEGSINAAPPAEDHVSKLNQYFQKKNHSSSTPVTYEKRQSKNKKTFTVAAVTAEGEISVGSGASLKEAKQDAAKKACEALGI